MSSSTSSPNKSIARDMVLSIFTKGSTKYEKRLLSLCLNISADDHDTFRWNQNAVQYLVRRLRNTPNALDELARALTQKCSNTKCLLVPKVPDKRLMISHRRGLPQVIYCRMWRWPDLQSHHQIKAIPTCESCIKMSGGIELPSSSHSVCINPYHYERTQTKPIEPIQVPFFKIPPDLSTSFEDSDTAGGTRARPHGMTTNVTTITGSTVRTLLSSSLSSLTERTNHDATQRPHPQASLQLQRSPSQTSPQQQQQQQSDPQTAASGAAAAATTSAGAVPQQQQQTASQAIPPPQQQQQARKDQSQQQQYSRDRQQFHSQSTQQHYQQTPRFYETSTSQEQFRPQTSPQYLPQYQQQIEQQQQQQQQQQPQPGTNAQYTADQYPQQLVEQYQQQNYQSLGQFDQSTSEVYQSSSDQYNLSQPQIYQPTQQTAFMQHQSSPSQVPPCSQPSLNQHMTVTTEIAQPFRFKQSKFAHLARARHEHALVSLHPRYDPHGYVTSPYTYSTVQPQRQQQPQPLRQQPPQQQQHAPSAQYPQQSQQAYSPQCASATTFTQPASQQQLHYSRPQGYQAYGSQQVQYAQPEQMQLDYQDASMTVTCDQGTLYKSEEDTPAMPVEQGVIDIQEVPYIEGTYWCSICYHEYDQRIGEKYHSSYRVVSVDGYTQPMCNDRFCIGGISNVNRNQFTEWVRRRIGRGVRLTYVDGIVYVEGLSESSIFVSNPLLVEEEGDRLIEHVSKLGQGCSTKVFNTQQFQRLLSEAVTKGFEAVYKLTNACIIRISFVKGWGRNYKRQSIYNTPCWVEVQLNGPLQWIDKVLRQMRPPTGCGSTS